MPLKRALLRAYIAVVVISALQLAQSTVVLRVRLSSGAMQRFEIDEECETISGLRQKLRDQGAISTEDVSFTLKEQSYSALLPSISVDLEDLAIIRLGLKSGDILNIIKPAAAKDVIVSSESDVSNVTSTPRVQSKKVQKKKPTSIADLEKKRKELLKVTRQKSSKGRSVSMTSSAGRILNRIAETGGYALLMGKIMMTKVEKNSSKKGTSIAAIAKLDSAIKERVEVHAVCEVYQYSTDPSEDSSSKNSLPENLSDLPSVGMFLQIAKSLGLQIVGCCVGLPKGSQTKDGKAVMWSADHVFSALQIRNAVSSSKEDSEKFIILSVCKAVSQENIPEESAKKKMLKKAKALVADGISLESFQLSDQANVLYEKNILPLVRIRKVPKSSSFLSFSSKTNAMLKLAEQASGKNGQKNNNGKTSKSNIINDSDHNDDKVELDGEILIQSTEVTSVDPYLLAVPLPITTLKSIITKKIQKFKKLKKGEKDIKEVEDSDDNILEFEHSFPSEIEIHSNHETSRLAKLHFNRILASLSTDGTKERMRDPHLLLYISRILDLPTRDSLCRSLMDGTNRFPGMVKVALDMVKMSLDTSRSDSNSVGKRSGRFLPNDDDDDDE